MSFGRERRKAPAFLGDEVHAVAQGRDDARVLFERLLALQNDLGLLAEEYDPRARRVGRRIETSASEASPIRFKR
jgi:hypothetical protein